MLHSCRVTNCRRPQGTAVIITVFLMGASQCGPGLAGDESPRFEDVARSANLTFVHHSPFTPERHLHLTMGSGVAWLDFDQDGWPDLYLGQGRGWRDAGHDPEDGELVDCLMRNLGGRFVDVTAQSRIRNPDYAMGIAVGDANQDGFPDLYVTSFGCNRLFLNNGDGRFTDRSDAFGPAAWAYGASCTWTDIDADGLLDLYVANYLEIDPHNYTTCSQRYRGRSVKLICPPRKYPWTADRLYRNSGDGGFEDVSAQSGIHSVRPLPGLGVVTGDFDQDADLDLYVANDTTENLLWINDGRGRFTNAALLSGTAFNRIGEGEAGMGVDAGDVDGDGRIDLFVTNYHGETNTLYRNEGNGLFLDVTNAMGLGPPSRTRLAFGTLLADFDGDGFLDAFIANGHLSDRLPDIGQHVAFRQRAQLMWNSRGRRFVDFSANAGRCFQRETLGRGCAAADYDRDGRLDVAVINLGEQASLLRNVSRSDNRALRLRLIGRFCNRSAIGARVTVELPEGNVVRLRRGSSSYLSCSEEQLLIGIGPRDAAPRIRIDWPGGESDVWNDVPAGRSIVLVEGDARMHVAH